MITQNNQSLHGKILKYKHFSEKVYCSYINTKYFTVKTKRIMHKKIKLYVQLYVNIA